MLDAVGDVEWSSGRTSPAAADFIAFIERIAGPPTPVRVRTIATAMPTAAVASIMVRSFFNHGLSPCSLVRNRGSLAAMGTAAPVSSTVAFARAALWQG
jgi:hypothetical protein